jgi:retron-type reverse transcriptase
LNGLSRLLEIVQGALLHVMEPIFERDFAPQSYGFRPGKGCKDALRRVDELLKSGYHWVVDADLKGYFDSIPQEGLMERIKEKIADGRVSPKGTGQMAVTEGFEARADPLESLWK